MRSAISTADLVKRFPRSTGYLSILPWQRGDETSALDGISLEIAEGEFFGLLGPNGAGKTTLMKILSTLVIPTSGRALVCGKDVATSDAEVRSLVGLITADERSFYWRLTGRQNLEFFAALYHFQGRDGKRRVEGLLELLGLTEVADRRFQTYSSGMRQKMAIARGLLPDPRVLLVDEPTRSLDPLSARTVRDFLKEKVARTGCTVILATHQMAEAEELCDRVAILHHGRVLACGTVGELRLAHRRDRCFLEVSGLDAGRCRGLDAVPGVSALKLAVEGAGAFSLEVGLEDSRRVLPQLIEEIVAAGGRIHSCNLRERALEEVFVDLVSDAYRDGAGSQAPVLVGAGGQLPW